MAGAGWWSKRLAGRRTTYEGLEDLVQAGASLQHVQIEGRSPLLFACSCCDEQLAQRMVSQHLLFGLDLDESDGEAGYTALHYCCEMDMPELARALLDAGADFESTTEDMPALFGAFIPGGRTALHIASMKGSKICAELLVQAGADIWAEDWEGNTPFLLACLSSSSRGGSVAAYLQRISSSRPPKAPRARLMVPPVEWLGKRRKECESGTANRMAAENNPTGIMAVRHVLRHAFTDMECRWLAREVQQVVSGEGAELAVSTAAVRFKAREAAGNVDSTDVVSSSPELQQQMLKDSGLHPQYDIRCSDMQPTIDRWVKKECTTRVFPHLAARYGFQERQLAFRDLFFVKYTAPSNGTAMHADGSILSFNLLLNQRADFEGGGTYFEEDQTTEHIERGDVLMHCGRLRHKGAPLVTGERFVLVAFINVKGRYNTGAAATSANSSKSNSPSAEVVATSPLKQQAAAATATAIATQDRDALRNMFKVRSSSS